MPPVNRNQPVRAASTESQFSLMEFMRDYPDDATCLETLWRTRYSADGVHADCPKCEVSREFKRYETAQQRQSWTCVACATKLHPTAGTIFHKSSTSLHLWFYAMYLMTSTRCGISAKQLERELGVTYKTAWRMAHLIRTELMEDEGEPLSGTVEADETFIGGKPRYLPGERPMRADGSRARGKRPATHGVQKQPVFGMVERNGRVVATTVANVRKTSLMPHIESRILPKSTVYTDELKTYNSLNQRGYAHSRVQHKQRIYVSGDVHTNTIEGFWSLLKRGIGGVYHSVSAKHLQGYPNEYAWRYNHRDDRRAMFALLLERAARS